MYEREPVTDIYLCRVNFSEDNNHILDFVDINSQNTFFDNLPGKFHLEDATFQRKNMYIRMDGKFDQIQLYNYGWYDNHLEYMRYYFFITDVEYRSDESSFVYIKIDPWQTYQFQLKYKPCFIERKHVTDDVAGNHTYPEMLESGEYIIQNKIETITSATDMYYMISVTQNLMEKESELPSDLKTNVTLNNGVINGTKYIVFDSVSSLSKTIKYYNDEGKNNAIVSVSNLPKKYIPIELTWYESGQIADVRYAYIPRSVYAFGIGNITGTKPSSLGYNNAYTPINKKLLTYPYVALLVDNHAGSVGEYKFEDFNSDGFIFEGRTCITPSCNTIYIPLNYKMTAGESNTRNFNEIITGTKLPLGSWNNDVFSNWYAQNALNLGVTNVAGGIKIVGGLGLMLTGGGTLMGAGLLASGTMDIMNMFGQMYQHSMVPNQINGNANNGNINIGMGIIDPTFYTVTIKPEYARIIDNYFSKYGYKVNKLETPKIRTRSNWNYLKTMDIQFDIDLTRPIPQMYELELKSMFNNGVTIWHNYANMYNYNLSNNVI